MLIEILNYSMIWATLSLINLFWVVKNRASKKYGAIIDPLVNPRLLAAMFYAIDYEALQNASTRRIPLADLLRDDTTLLTDILCHASV